MYGRPRGAYGPPRGHMPAEVDPAEDPFPAPSGPSSASIRGPFNAHLPLPHHGPHNSGPPDGDHILLPFAHLGNAWKILQYLPNEAAQIFTTRAVNEAV